ncbi:ESX secretion-associated protein EspG [Tsukamurella paurometabola]|uniref:ESX secretion-associated protein EspG n=1 Tax=Tsukamurella paurometabola (strain ATCC 8368 / DSM 20162 / CCUG 35730 / CIP 100753 / JCM 10117 / KCTC 9821 / NBRC 16120 / NCIMB 702349 / NCTC 13040) TaxID=521096 RepID=D5URC0_TSUPD|nr:ESX secretion-associated protein EspG [Tsukamurella paurometabola]ADG76973.1 hypothetical protein Tpau_0330 [Tsukamurella paurometabola DSM 20162]SUP42350.1 ESX-1 secretion-associated protein EspG1 [Tsukamurella paurometabola]
MPDNDSGGGLSAFGVSIDELSLLMRLADVTELAPIVLAVHPNVYRPDDQSAVDLAVLPGLIAAGLVDADGAIDPEVARWLRALQAPAAEIALRVFDGDSALRGAIVRHDDLVVVVFRHDDLLTLQGYRTDGEDFDSTVVDPVWRVLGSCDPADFDSLTLGAAELREIVSMYNPASTDPRGEREFRGRLREHDLPPHTVDVLVDAARYSGRRAEVVYHRVDLNGVRTQAQWALGVMDTDQGRVLSTTTRGRGGDNDVILSPGTRRRFAEGLNELVARGGCVGWFDIAN